MSQRDPARETLDDENEDILWDAVRFLSGEGLIGEPPPSRRTAHNSDASRAEVTKVERKTTTSHVEGRRHAVLLP